MAALKISLQIILAGLLGLLAATVAAQAEPRLADIARLVTLNGVASLEGETQPFTGMAVGYYDNGRKRLEIDYRDGLRHGEERVWYENGEPMHLVRYVEGEPQSLGSVWYLRSDAELGRPRAALEACTELSNPTICAPQTEPRAGLMACEAMPDGEAVCGVTLPNQPANLVRCNDLPADSELCREPGSLEMPGSGRAAETRFEFGEF